MTCPRCRVEYPAGKARCPQCDEPNPDLSGVFHSSTVLISEGRAERVYRSVQDVPERLRTRLTQSTSGRNAATILIADRRGRIEIAKALRKLPGSAQRRLVRSILTGPAAAGAGWFTRGRRRVLAAIVVVGAVVVTALVFAFRW